MDSTTATIIVTAIIAVLFLSFFAVFRKQGKAKIKAPFGIGLEVEGNNEPAPTSINEFEAVGNIQITEGSVRGLGRSKLKAGGNVIIGNVSNENQIQKQVEPREQPISKISMREIVEKIEAATPYQRNDIMRYHVGLKIDWAGNLSSVSDKKNNEFSVTLKIPKKSEYPCGYVNFEVPANEHPQLKLLPENHPMRVAGIIEKFAYHDMIDLKEAVLFY